MGCSLGGAEDVEEEQEEEEEEEEVEEDEDLTYNVEYVEDLDESDDEEAEVEDAAENLTALYERVAANRAQRLKRKAEGGTHARRNARVEVEYEVDEPVAKKETAW